MEFGGGISFGSFTQPPPGLNDLSRHIDLWGGLFGYNITAGSMNHHVAAGSQHWFYVGDRAFLRVTDLDVRFSSFPNVDSWYFPAEGGTTAILGFNCAYGGGDSSTFTARSAGSPALINHDIGRGELGFQVGQPVAAGSSLVPLELRMSISAIGNVTVANALIINGNGVIYRYGGPAIGFRINEVNLTLDVFHGGTQIGFIPMQPLGVTLPETPGGAPTPLGVTLPETPGGAPSLQALMDRIAALEVEVATLRRR
jgi:hypothetical protein